MTRPTCAICADELQPKEHVTREPLGKDGAMVIVCEACRSEPPRALTSDRQWEPSGGLPSPEESTAGARRAMGAAEFERQGRIEEQLSRQPAPAANASEADWRRYVWEGKRRNKTRASQSRGVRSSREKKLY